MARYAPTAKDLASRDVVTSAPDGALNMGGIPSTKS
jgi:hypothetical protein